MSIIKKIFKEILKYLIVHLNDVDTDSLINRESRQVNLAESYLSRLQLLALDEQVILQSALYDNLKYKESGNFNHNYMNNLLLRRARVLRKRVLNDQEHINDILGE